jgi:hypothetical protein
VTDSNISISKKMKIERNKPFNTKNVKETINATDLLGLHYAVANQRRRKKLIQVVDGPDGRVVETKDMIQVAIYY